VDSAEDEDMSLAILDARLKSKGRREILNLVSSINYSDARASTRHRKWKAHVR
jgi:galactose-1-phosphate uridylyltransferase